MKKSNKKPRFIGVEFKVYGIPREELKTLKIGAGYVDGKYQVIIKTDSRTIPTHAVKGFRRETKPGFNLKKIYHKSDSGSLEPNAFLDGIDQLFGIDTNSKVMFGANYSVGVAACLTMQTREHHSYDIQAEVVEYFVHTDHIEKGENRNWKLLIDAYSSKSESKGIKTGIVVDSDLGLIDQFNSREIPIWENFYLPNNITLIYASSDIKNDTIINQLIAFCDEESTKYLNEIETRLTNEFTRLKTELIKQNPELESEITSYFETIHLTTYS